LLATASWIPSPKSDTHHRARLRRREGTNSPDATRISKAPQIALATVGDLFQLLKGHPIERDEASGEQREGASAVNACTSTLPATRLMPCRNASFGCGGGFEPPPFGL